MSWIYRKGRSGEARLSVFRDPIRAARASRALEVGTIATSQPNGQHTITHCADLIVSVACSSTHASVRPYGHLAVAT